MVDTGIFYGYFDTKDLHHLDSIAILYHSLEGRFGRPFSTDYVVLETTTLLKARIGARVSVAFLDFLKKSGIRVNIVDEEAYRNAIAVFQERSEKLSFSDASTLVVMKELEIVNLASFEERSFSGLVKDILGNGYFNSLQETEKKRFEKIAEQ